ncbi:MAG: hypothetical protein ABH857_01295 [Elusimicrobiota bacterium]
MKKIFSLILSLLILTSPAFSETWPNLLKKINNKYAGFEDQIKTKTIEQSLISYTPQGEINTEAVFYSQGDKFRVEAKIDMANLPPQMKGMTTISIFDSENMWIISPLTGKKKIPIGRNDKPQTGIDWWKELAETAKIIGNEKIEKNNCYVIDASKSNSAFTKLWLDEKELILRKAEGNSPQQGKMLYEFSDFKILKGSWKVPYKTTIHMNETISTIATVTSFKINETFRADLFDPSKIESTGGMNIQDMINMMSEYKKQTEQ